MSSLRPARASTPERSEDAAATAAASAPPPLVPASPCASAPSPGSDRHLAAHEALLHRRVQEAVDLNQDVFVFGYGSLVWKPDVEYDCRVNVTLHGYLRRFIQASPDHRGRPGQWGRVVTLVREEEADEVLGAGWRRVEGEEDGRGGGAPPPSSLLPPNPSPSPSPSPTSTASTCGGGGGGGSSSCGAEFFAADALAPPSPSSSSSSSSLLSSYPSSSSSSPSSSSRHVVHGTAFRLVPHAAHEMLARLCTREKAGYDCHAVTVLGEDGVERRAFAFVSDGRRSANPFGVGGEAEEDTARVIASAAGASGTNLEYFVRLLVSMRERGVVDGHLERLWAHVRRCKGWEREEEGLREALGCSIP